MDGVSTAASEAKAAGADNQSWNVSDNKGDKGWPNMMTLRISRNWFRINADPSLSSLVLRHLSFVPLPCRSSPDAISGCADNGKGTKD